MSADRILALLLSALSIIVLVIISDAMSMYSKAGQIEYAESILKEKELLTDIIIDLNIENSNQCRKSNEVEFYFIAKESRGIICLDKNNYYIINKDIYDNRSN